MLRNFLIITFLFSYGVLFAQNDSISEEKSWYDYKPRFYNTSPCGGCPDFNSKDYKPKMFMDNPYKYKSNNPIVIPDSMLYDYKILLYRNNEPDSLKSKRKIMI